MATKKKTAKKTASQPIILCAGEHGRCLLHGYVTHEPEPGQPVRLERARMVIYYPSGGALGLAVNGPPKSAAYVEAALV
jgi:hypothetical protein